MSHYPSSAELAAFRRRIRETQAHPSQHDLDRDTFMGHPTRIYTDSGVFAWSDELRDGIGSRGYLAGASASFDRREASWERSRAYARGIGSLADRETFAPSPWAAPFLDIPGDAGCDCGTGDAGHILASDTWSDEDAPRSPLPIRYQPSFIITR